MLKPFTKRQNLRLAQNWPKLKVFADDNINVNQKLKFDLERIENIFLFPQCFQKSGLCGKELDPLPNYKISDLDKFKTFADKKINANKVIFGLEHCGRRRKCWIPAFSPFPTIFF